MAVEGEEERAKVAEGVKGLVERGEGRIAPVQPSSFPLRVLACARPRRAPLDALLAALGLARAFQSGPSGRVPCSTACRFSRHGASGACHAGGSCARAQGAQRGQKGVAESRRHRRRDESARGAGACEVQALNGDAKPPARSYACISDQRFGL